MCRRHSSCTYGEVRLEAAVRAVRSILVLSLVLGAKMLPAAVHPVPLDKNTDSAKCIECHEDKAKGKYVHSAIATGCTSCHEIRVNKDVTRVKLITTTPQALCITCHANKDAASLHGTVHPPAVRDCVKCHDPHQSDNKYQLAEADFRRQRAEPLSDLPYPGTQRSREGQPARGAGYGLRDLPRYPQGWRKRERGVRLSPHQVDPGAVPRLSRCDFCRLDQSASGSSRSLRRIACSATIRTSQPNRS